MKYTVHMSTRPRYLWISPGAKKSCHPLSKRLASSFTWDKQVNRAQKIEKRKDFETVVLLVMIDPEDFLIWCNSSLLANFDASRFRSSDAMVLLMCQRHNDGGCTNRTMICEWMNEWMNGWKNEWMNEWKNEWMNEGTNERTNEWMSESMSHRISKSMNGWFSEAMS
jgi:hypothetical protein